MNSSIDVHNYLQELEIPHEIFKHSGQAATLERAAAAQGIEPSELARVDIFRVNGEAILVIAAGDREIDTVKLVRVAGGDSVQPVPEEEIPSLTGYLAQGLPPFAHSLKLKTYIDYSALKEDVVYSGCGEPTAILKIRSYDLVRATGGEIADLVTSPKGG
jgi:prolyl-tRNA editing enzyme YbaK/EbsC (Cys-tRNA(Pro) deacylase)